MSVFARTSFSAKSYAAFRPSYPTALYTKVLSYTQTKDTTQHKTCLLDLGCGHGIAASSLSQHFTEVIGLDPSAAMIQQARSQHAQSNITFRTGPAEDLSFLPDASVDLVVSAQAAHWFDYGKLWLELARVVKPTGSLAFWGYKDNMILGFPEANRIFDHFIYGQGEVAPGVVGMGRFWEQPGRNILRQLYRSIQPPEGEWRDIQRYEHEPGEEVVPEWTLRRRMTLGALDGYLHTFSSYKAWKDEFGEKEGQKDVVDVLWETVIEAVEPWKARKDNWRDIEIETDWGTCLILAKRR